MLSRVGRFYRVAARRPVDMRPAAAEFPVASPGEGSADCRVTLLGSSSGLVCSGPPPRISSVTNSSRALVLCLAMSLRLSIAGLDNTRIRFSCLLICPAAGVTSACPGLLVDSV